MLLWILHDGLRGLPSSSTDGARRVRGRRTPPLLGCMPKRHLPAARGLITDGVLTRAALTDASLNDDLGDRLAREGGGLRLAPSTYRLGAGPVTDLELVAAAAAHAGQDVVVTGLLALRLLGVPDVPHDDAVDVLVPAARRRTSTSHVRVHSTHRTPATWLHASGIRVAEPHRAVVDAACRMATLRAVRALVLGAVCQRWCGVGELRAELDARARNGTALCRRALRDAERGALSAPEAELADVVAADPRLPRFLLNPTLLVDGVRVGQPDGWFVGLGLGWEVDSRRHHADDEAFDATLARHDRFGTFGLQLLHVTPKRARLLGAGYADVLAAAVAARRRAVQPEPSGLVVRPHDPRTQTLRRLTPAA